ncbi:MAG: class I SAM-dependent methyltransferase [Patescibacteria group bacterium]
MSQKDLMRDKSILDIGGKKKNKRGLFDIGLHSQDVKYINIDLSTNPDIVSDATKIPLPARSADVIIMGEILEHVPEPLKVLKEGYRLLKPGGYIIATVPFMYPVHADPEDFGRYTDYYWKDAAMKLGFSDIVIERQGGMFAILALAVQHFFRAKGKTWGPIQNPLVNFLMWLDKHTQAPLLLDWTTGYGLVFRK